MLVLLVVQVRRDPEQVVRGPVLLVQVRVDVGSVAVEVPMEVPMAMEEDCCV